MNSKEAKQQAETRQKELADLTAQRDAAAQELEALQTERAAAVRKLAAGDGSQRKAILALEEQGKPLKLRVEGLDGLMVEHQAALVAAQAALKDVEAQEQVQEAAAIQKAEFEACETIGAAAPDLEARIVAAYFVLSDALAELALASARLAAHPGPGRQAIVELREKLHWRLDKHIAASGRRLLNSNLGTNVHPSIAYTQEMGGCLFQGGLNLVDLFSKVLGPRIAQKHREEYQKREVKP